MRCPPASHRVRRRTFLELLGVAAASAAQAACAIVEPLGDAREDDRGDAPGGAADPRSGSGVATTKSAFLAQNPFHLGVASGDPQSDRVMLWTRLVDNPLPTKDGALRIGELDGVSEVVVRWAIATDPLMKNVVRSGVVIARPESGHTVRVDADGLTPSTTYHYQFRTGEHGEHASAIGRTRTLPAPDASPERMRFAVACCQNWQEGHYAAHAHLAREDIDFVLFLGDYIYEEGIRADGVRKHEGDAPKTLPEYRRRHALYKSDLNLQAAHAAHPWIAIWDDHEVAGNYAAQFATEVPGLPPSQFLERRAAAYEAYWEHMPLRSPSPSGPSMHIYRDFKLGDLARLMMLDGRQYRSKPPCDGKVTTKCDARNDSVLSMLGLDQERWLLDTLASATERWKLIGNGTMMSPTVVAGSLVNTDQWDGFTAERQRLFDAFAQRDGVVVMTGDIHCTVLSELPSDATNARSPKIGVELVTTSMSSTGIPEILSGVTKVAAAVASHLKYVNTKMRGYLVCELTRDALTVSLRGLDNGTETSGIHTVASWKIRHGESKIEPA